MKEFLLVDGYNIINTWPELKKIAEENLEYARQRLIDILLDFQGYRGYKVILVFDAHNIKNGREVHEFYGEVEVVYTRENETADEYIERWVDGMGKTARVWVATSDYVEQTIVFARGANRISARELWMAVRDSKEEYRREFIEKLDCRAGLIESRIKPEMFRKLERMRREG